MESKNSLQNTYQTPPLFQSKSEISSIAKIGFLLKKHERIISLIQWGMVSFYFFLLLAPFAASFLETSHAFWKELHIFSVLVFWGFGWPLILLSTMVFGRIWCGIFCPDGTLTEKISYYGKQQSIPRWMRWSKWPQLTFIVFTLSLFFSGAAYQYQSTAVLLGFFTFLALLTGFLYGKGRRIWCMYLCPSNVIFTLLAKLSPFHFQVDRKKWDSYQGKPKQINCAPLIHIKQMESTSFCHACGRCNDYRNAIKTAVRSFDHEILSDISKQTSTSQALTLLYGMIGLGTTLFLFSLPFFQETFTANLFLMMAVTLGSSLLIGSLLWGMIWFSWKKCLSDTLSWQQLALGLIPLAGAVLLLGMTPVVFRLVEPALWVQKGLFVLQQLLLLIALLLSIWLGWKLIVPKNSLKTFASMTTYCMAAVIPAVFWSIVFWMQIRS